MDTALDDMARALGVAPLHAEEMRLLLDATRNVAHAGERRHAPLAAFLLGVAVGASPDRAVELTAAVSRLLAVLPVEGPAAG